eukprot:scaffold301685_cov17-Tisochrysis_lutea.AAC.1
MDHGGARAASPFTFTERHTGTATDGRTREACVAAGLSHDVILARLHSCLGQRGKCGEWLGKLRSWPLLCAHWRARRAA